MASSIKKLREEAETIRAITSKEELLKALTVLAKMQDLNEINRANLNRCVQLANTLADLCTEYAASHQEVFDGGAMIRNQNGVHVGDITDGGEIHHLACGFDGYIRANGEKLTQDFLEALPKSWRKSKFSIDTTGINKAVDKGAEVSAYGLIDKPNNVWTHKSV